MGPKCSRKQIRRRFSVRHDDSVDSSKCRNEEVMLWVLHHCEIPPRPCAEAPFQLKCDYHPSGLPCSTGTSGVSLIVLQLAIFGILDVSRPSEQRGGWG